MTRRETSPGVFYSDNPIMSFSDGDIDFLVDQARCNTKQRARICAHSNEDDPVHEMLICLLPTSYIRPHKHSKFESLHVIRGSCDLVLFDDAGDVTGVIQMSNDGLDVMRYIRLSPSTYHTLRIRSEYLVFHETTSGPWKPEDTTYAPWSSADAGCDLSLFLHELEKQSHAWRSSNPSTQAILQRSCFREGIE